MYGPSTIHTIELGGTHCHSVALTSLATFRLDATTDELAYNVRISDDMTIDQIGLMITTLTGTPTYQVSLQSVTATTGDPSGTILGGGSPASTQYAPTGGAGWKWITLDNGVSVSKGDVIAIVIEDGTSGTNPSASHYIDIARHDTQILQSSQPFALESTDTGSTWTPINSDMPMYGFRNSGDTTVVQGYPVPTPFAQPASVAVTTGEISAQKFVLPASFGRRVQVHGLAFGMCYTNTLWRAGIYQEDATALIETATIDEQNAESVFHMPIVYFTPTWINTGETLYAGLENQDGVSSMFIYCLNLNNANDLSAFTGSPNNCHSAWNGTSWDDDPSITTSCRLLVSAWDKHGVEVQHLEKGMSR